ncbi:cell division protein FtsQ/DivIB [Microvirga brassicacearum]|uniref:Cell division protein FtsQ n=1 Tax=Microvirga brassicacearum TaxID=2580413 RepID=A0A5N3PB83_9HYPH|nr:cell division protein FtsQ/DivIB [Microvirga brassicacearum]KAB0267022.1 FtsQ-type POTRA domain-containing protein [Microvirga brassicacearum]
MDGGGRYLQPMTASRAGGTVARVNTYEPAKRQSTRLPFVKIFSSSRSVRRRSDSLPLARRIPRHLGSGLTLGFLAAVVTVGLWQGGHLDDFIRSHGEPHHAAARLAGLGLEQVTISGIAQMRENEVLAAAGLDWRVSLPFLDVNEVRERLERVPLVSSASVRKLYPNELVIGLTERAPHALWQLNGELFIIASDGTVIDLMQDGRFIGLPLVVGDRANLRNNDYLNLLEAAGPLKSRIRAGTLVSGRRWNLKMDNGMDVRLPERGAADAVSRLVKLEREQKILEKDVLAVDLRMPDRVVVRLTEEAASARADALKQKKMRGKGVDT